MTRRDEIRERVKECLVHTFSYPIVDWRGLESLQADITLACEDRVYLLSENDRLSGLVDRAEVIMEDAVCYEGEWESQDAYAWLRDVREGEG